MRKVKVLLMAAVVAMAATLMAQNITLSVEDIVAGKTVQFVGDINLNSTVLSITGSDFSALDRNRSYDLAVTSGGIFTGNPEITFDANVQLPEGWKIRIRGSRITLRATGNTIRILLEGTK